MQSFIRKHFSKFSQQSSQPQIKQIVLKCNLTFQVSQKIDVITGQIQIFQIIQSLQNKVKSFPTSKMDYQGHICLIYGPMFSGKSSELLRKIRRYQHAKKRCLVVNYLHDNRYSSGDVMATHDKITHKALKASKLTDILSEATKYDVVGIDEGQFFQDIAEVSEQLANSGIVVIIAALDSTFQRKPFGNIINLVPLAQKVYKLTAVCVYCTEPAAFTQRTVESQEIELVGGAESYKPVCRMCFHNPPLQNSKVESTSTIEQAEQAELREDNIEDGQMVAV